REMQRRLTLLENEHRNSIETSLETHRDRLERMGRVGNQNFQSREQQANQELSQLENRIHQERQKILEENQAVLDQARRADSDPFYRLHGIKTNLIEHSD